MDQFLSKKFQALFSRDPTVVVRAPGRVNLLGAHVDYNEGWVLPAAIDRAIWLAAAPRSDRQARLMALDLGQDGGFSLDTLEVVGESTAEQARIPGWLRFPAGVAWALQAAGCELVGIDAVIAGDLPIGAGVSSSAALEVAFILAWEILSDLSLTGIDRATLGQKAENQFLGVASGIMDQFASLHGKAGHLIFLDCRTLDHQLVPLPGDLVILVADSGVRRELASSEYNLRRQQCRKALEMLRMHLPGIRALRDVQPDQFSALDHHLPELLRKRAEHVIRECARVHEGVRALRRADLAAFGDTVRRSHLSSRDLYQVSISELDLLAEAAWRSDGCIGARLTGAGFGGCVVALVEADAASEVGSRMSNSYETTFGRRPEVFTCRAAGGAEWTVRNG